MTEYNPSGQAAAAAEPRWAAFHLPSCASKAKNADGVLWLEFPPDFGDFPPQAVHSERRWLGRESNPRHEDFQSSALPTELPSRCDEGGFYAPRAADQVFAAAEGMRPGARSAGFGRPHSTGATGRASAAVRGTLPAETPSRRPGIKRTSQQASKASTAK